MTFVGGGEAATGARRLHHVKPPCAHEGFYEIRSTYDRRRGVLTFIWTCERCGAELREVCRESYRPRYDPHGADPFIALARLRSGDVSRRGLAPGAVRLGRRR